jgi:hypothetical protein
MIEYLIIFGILYILAVSDVHAYLDPGSGSFFLQIFAASILSAIFVIKKFWKNIVNFIGRRLKNLDDKAN